MEGREYRVVPFFDEGGQFEIITPSLFYWGYQKHYVDDRREGEWEPLDRTEYREKWLPGVKELERKFQKQQEQWEKSKKLGVPFYT